MNKKIFWIILGLLLISFTLQEDTNTEGDEGQNDDTGNEALSDEKLCEAKTEKDECLKVKLSSDDKKCCFYRETFPGGKEETACFPKLTDEEKKSAKEEAEEGYELKEECSGKFITPSILVLLALLFFN